MNKFDSKSFNAQAFGAYVKRIPKHTKSELANSKAVGTNEQAKEALSSQNALVYAKVPYFGRISGATSQNNDGSSDITSTNTTTYEQGFIVANRMDSWTERSFSKNIGGNNVDFMDNVAEQISDYKMEVKQNILLSILKGIYSMKTTGTLVHEKAGKEFMEKHTYDITSETGVEDAGLIKATVLNKAIQQASGDNKNIFKLVIMHSEVATNLENLKLLKYMTYTDSSGIERELTLATWNGRTVLVDDNMPTEEVVDGEETYTKYTTYVLGENAIVLDEIGDAVPYEMNRDPKTNGGQDTLYIRDRYVCGVEGISFEKPASISTSASNSDLENGLNWHIINDGTAAIPHKAIPITRIISKG